MIQGLDHVAIGVADFDGQSKFFIETLGLELRRLGTRHGAGTRIAMLADSASAFKVELIETSEAEAGLAHVAVRVDDVQAEYERLLGQGLKSLREPHALAAARARTALLQEASGLKVQIIEYAADSPDIG